jgi:hypothetical protein
MYLELFELPLEACDLSHGGSRGIINHYSDISLRAMFNGKPQFRHLSNLRGSRFSS